MKCEQETHGKKKTHTQGIKIDPTFIEVDGKKVKEKHFCTEKTD